MKRGLKYCLLIALVMVTMVFSPSLQWEEIRARGWLVDTLYAAAVNAAPLMLFYTAGHDPKLSSYFSINAKILFWVFAVLFVLGRIVPYVFA